MSLLARSCLVVLTLSMGAVPGCQRPQKERPRAERAILERQIHELEKLLQPARSGPIVPFEDGLLSIDQSLIESLMKAALPYETVVNDQIRIRILDAAVSCEDGLALVRLSGRASFSNQPEQDAFAEATVYGALRQFELRRAESVLRGRVDVIAFEVQQVKVFGDSTETGKGLLHDLARLRLEAFQGIDYNFDIPVRLQDLVLPEYASNDVHIPAATIPLPVSVTDVNALRGKLWISLRLHDAPTIAAGRVPRAADSTRGAR